MEDKFDTIIIGSGIGGLTVASLLSQLFNKRVLILEQHFKFGGYTHTFKRKDWEWDVGIHYIGEMEKGSTLYNLISFLTEGKIQWFKMEEPFEEFIYPEIRFPIYGDKQKFCEDLIELFPEEKENIIEYFNDIEKFSTWFNKNLFFQISPNILKNFFSPLHFSKSIFITTQEYLDYRFKSEKLKSVVTSRWGDYGLPPFKSNFLIHSLIEKHYWNGGWYPIGGSSNFAKMILPTIEKNGGQALLSHRVDKILIKNNKAIGVEVSVLNGQKPIEKKIFYSDIIVSDAGLYNTYELVDETNLETSIKEKLTSLKQDLYSSYSDAISNVTLYIGLKEDPRKFGIKPRNYWIYKDFNHNSNFNNFSIENFPKGIYVSFPSSKNPEAKAHTAEIISFIPYEFFTKWKDQKWKNRDEEYEELKEKISEKLINFANEFLPNFKDNISYKELSTPLTNEFFTLHLKGSIYGIPFTNYRLQKKWITPNTIISNLFLTGADSFTPGFSGAMMGGFLCTSQIAGYSNIFSLLKLLKKKIPSFEEIKST